jgi:hypothetical protein
MVDHLRFVPQSVTKLPFMFVTISKHRLKFAAQCVKRGACITKSSGYSLFRDLTEGAGVGSGSSQGSKAITLRIGMEGIPSGGSFCIMCN